MMDSFGGVIGRLTFHNLFLGCLPCMYLSFRVIKWAIEKVGLRSKMPSLLLMMLLCLPNFCIWTTIYSKEFIGLIVSAIFGVLFYKYFRGNYKLHKLDYIAFYLCLLFKPQYLPFIMQGLFYIFFSKKYLRSPKGRTMLALVFLIINICFIIVISPLINELASIMYIHFDPDGTSTRPNPFVNNGDFFRYLPVGMIVAFWGPTINEMIKSPLMLIAGVESLIMVSLFVWLSARIIKRVIMVGNLSPIPFFAIMLTTIGLLFIHYPFGVFNPGAAIRYRVNFIFLFIMLLCYLYVYPMSKKRDIKI